MSNPKTTLTDMKTKTTNTVILMIVLFTMAGACQDKGIVDNEAGIVGIPIAEIPDNPDYVSLPVVGTTWKLIGFADSKTNTIKLAEPSDGNTFTLTFEESGVISGITSTNQATGTYSLDDNNVQIAISPMTEINELYDGPLYLTAINKVHSYRLSVKGLELNHENNKYLLYKPFN